MSAQHDIEYRVLTMDDFAGSRDLMTDGTKREPIAIAVGVEPPKDTDGSIIKLLLPGMLKGGLSLGAYDKITHDLVGVRFVVVDHKNDPHHDKANPFFDPNNEETAQYSKVEWIEKTLHDNIDIFDTYGTSEFVHFYGLYVKEGYMGHGIATRLVDKAIKLVKEKGYKFACCEANSIYSCKIFDKFGFEKLNEIKFKDVERNGERLVINETGEHQTVCLYVKAL